jgi:hypothetical protein
MTRNRAPPPWVRTATRRALIAAGASAAVAPSLPTRAQAPKDAQALAAAKAYPRPRNDAYEVLEVGPGKRFPSLTLAGCFMNSEARWNSSYRGAEQTARMGFRVIISPGPPGYYVNDSGSHSRRWKSLVGWPPYEGNLLGPVIIEGEAGRPPPLLCTDGYGDGVLYYQTGLFATGDFDATFRRLSFQGFRRQDGNGNYAAIRLGQSFFSRPLGNRILVEDCEFSGCDDGILGGSPGQSVLLRRCEFHDNGNSTGLCHNIYVGEVDELVVEDLLSTRCAIGHLLKTRAAATTIRNSRLLGGRGAESACLDAPDAGVLRIEGLVCEKSPDSDASWLIHYSGESERFHDPSSITIRDLTLVAPPALRRHRSWSLAGFVNQSGAGPAASGKGARYVRPDAARVQAFGLSAANCGLPCEVLATRPTIDRRSPVAAPRGAA